MKQITEEKLRYELNSMRSMVTAIDEIMAPLIEKRRKIRRRINIAECRL